MFKKYNIDSKFLLDDIKRIEFKIDMTEYLTLSALWFAFGIAIGSISYSLELDFAFIIAILNCLMGLFNYVRYWVMKNIQ